MCNYICRSMKLKLVSVGLHCPVDKNKELVGVQWKEAPEYTHFFFFFSITFFSAIARALIRDPRILLLDEGETSLFCLVVQFHDLFLCNSY